MIASNAGELLSAAIGDSKHYDISESIDFWGRGYRAKIFFYHLIDIHEEPARPGPTQPGHNAVLRVIYQIVQEK